MLHRLDRAEVSDDLGDVGEVQLLLKKGEQGQCDVSDENLKATSSPATPPAEALGPPSRLFLAVLQLQVLEEVLQVEPPALADLLEAAEFGAAMALTSCLFAGQWDTVKISLRWIIFL